MGKSLIIGSAYSIRLLQMDASHCGQSKFSLMNSDYEMNSVSLSLVCLM